MIKKILATGLIACSVQAIANEQHTIEIKPDNTIVASKGIDVSSIETFEGLEAVDLYRNNLLDQLHRLSESDTTKSIAKSENLLERLTFADSIAEKIQKNQNNTKGQVSNYIGNCGLALTLNYTFIPGPYNSYNLETRASTSTGLAVNVNPPNDSDISARRVESGSSILEYTPEAVIFWESDYDTEEDNKWYLSAVSNVGSNYHDANADVRFISSGDFYIETKECVSYKRIVVHGSKTWATSPSNLVTIINP